MRAPPEGTPLPLWFGPRGPMTLRPRVSPCPRAAKDPMDNRRRQYRVTAEFDRLVQVELLGPKVHATNVRMLDLYSYAGAMASGWSAARALS